MGKEKQDKIKILLIDTDEFIKVFFRDIFWIHGLEDKYEIIITDQFKEAEKYLAGDSKPDIIFLDLMMPIQEEGRVKIKPEIGINFVKKIKSDAALKDIVVIIFYNDIDPEFQKQAKEAGAYKILLKGENLPRDILDEIENCFKT